MVVFKVRSESKRSPKRYYGVEYTLACDVNDFKIWFHYIDDMNHCSGYAPKTKVDFTCMGLRKANNGYDRHDARCSLHQFRYFFVSRVTISSP